MKRMAPLLEAVGILLLGAAVIAAAAARRVLADAPRALLSAAPPAAICYPDDVWVQTLGWPAWDVCGDSNGFHTCWRPTDHTGRHAEWNLATGQVTAVWPSAK